ncbi:hypothetical protein N3K66_002138 [Trichothecium roseum]|uniref:Uncharacterized protein n=1 Tax=Trichothecium roseum TaxID=47278 RepID=A0ACC0V8H7_9HYPO|nr:hypothetical protein N3K66_002138 [Trichothecium roseum]
MLLLHQVGSVKIGEVIRYTVTYTPSQDRILPSPERLYVRIKNTSAIALRAAFVHGPYTLSVAAYPAGFDPNVKFDDPHGYGVPEFEPMVKAGGSWECELVVPESIRQSAGTGAHGGFGKGPDHDAECASWVVEINSQVIFSTSAAVGYELAVARDRKSLSLGHALPVVSNQSQVPQPGRVTDLQQSPAAKDGHHPAQPKGVFSKAVRITVEDTTSLWNTPSLPSWEDKGEQRPPSRHAAAGKETAAEGPAENGDSEKKPRKQKKVHLVILTHGLHSNLGADMLYMKESIDAAAKQAKVDRRARRKRERASRGRSTTSRPTSTSTSPRADETSKDVVMAEADDESTESDDEEVICRGYSGNATKTERGIKYLGKRLARYVLSVTYPDQPHLPMGKDMADHAGQAAKGDKQSSEVEKAHSHGTIHTSFHRDHHATEKRPYKITSISFVAHSLGGLVQTYAVAYIQKHSPTFFDTIRPVNFVALATPFLGLSNENPMYVKFALDFGLVGRTGKDLGLTWRAPTLARSGWGAIVGNLGETAHKKVYGDTQPESKPLLRILPTGPAHAALKKFRNRTVYSNVVNDGIVPLRTSCLLFLDWHGLGRVEKARREAGLVETVVGFGWAEIMGTNMASSRQRQLPISDDQGEGSGSTTPVANGEDMAQVPQPSTNATAEDDRASLETVPTPYEEGPNDNTTGTSAGVGGPFRGFFNLFRNNEPPKVAPLTQKQKRIYDMSQTSKVGADSSTTLTSGDGTDSTEPARPAKVTAGQEWSDEVSGMNAPPRTTFFESAGDVLNPLLPDVEFLVDPSKRPRTIFHDRVYHPTDIPPPPMKKRPTGSMRRRRTFGRSPSQQSTSSAGSSVHSPGRDSIPASPDADNESEEVVDGSNMRVEEKIARGYHRDLSWRKVLVKLEPDAHNNIFVRRMFANAYGWPVVKHVVDCHFSDSATARMRTEDEHLGERARAMDQPPDEHGGETKGDEQGRASVVSETRTQSEAREALDQVPDLPSSAQPGQEDGRSPGDRSDSMTWSERDWADSEAESDIEFGDSKDKEEDKGRWDWAEKIVGKGSAAKVKETAAKENNNNNGPSGEQKQQKQQKQ